MLLGPLDENCENLHSNSQNQQVRPPVEIEAEVNIEIPSVNVNSDPVNDELGTEDRIELNGEEENENDEKDTIRENHEVSTDSIFYDCKTYIETDC